MTLTDIITKVGLEHITVQSLSQSLVKVNRKKRETDVTFATSHECGQSLMDGAMDGKETYVGLIVWLPKDRL